MLTLFAFSQENWQRPPEEIEALMALLQEYVSREGVELRERGVRGARARRARPADPGAPAPQWIPSNRKPRRGTALALNICLSYGSRAEITRAARLLAEEVRRARCSPAEVDEAALAGPALHCGLARPRSADPHLGRAPALQFPALASRLRRIPRDAGAVARLHPTATSSKPSSTFSAATAGSDASRRVREQSPHSCSGGRRRDPARARNRVVRRSSARRSW